MSFFRKIIGSPLFSFFWLIMSIIVFYTDKGISFADHNRFLILVYLSYIFCLFNWLGNGNRFFSLYVFFVFFALFYNTSQSLIYAFTENPTLLWVYKDYPVSDVCYMLKYQNMCIAAFYSGTCLFLSNRSHNLSHDTLVTYYQNKKNIFDKNEGKLMVIFILCISVVFVYSVYQIVLRQTYSYSELYEEREHISPYFSLGTMLIGLYFLYLKKHTKLVLFFYVWCIIAYTLAGTRSMAVVYVGALWLTVPMIYPQYFKKKYYPLMIVLALLLISSISIISDMRKTSVGSAYDQDSEMTALVASLNEMGISQMPTMVIIEHFHDEPYAQTILYATLLSVFPGFLLEEIVPSSWLIRVGSWATDESNQLFTQVGSSWLAESYLNFGEYGWLFTLFYGYLIAMAENVSLRRIMKGKYLLALCVLTCLCKQLFFVRAETILLVDYLKPCIYLGLLWLIFHKKIFRPI